LNIEPQAERFSAEQYRDGLAVWILDLGFTYSATFAFNRADEMTSSRAEIMLRDAFGRADSKLLGSRFNELPPERRTAYWFMVEKPQMNFHCQGFIRLGQGNWWSDPVKWRENVHAQYVSAIYAAWARVCPSGSALIQPMNYDGARYAIKTAFADMAVDRIIISPNLAVTAGP
jgi:hypothetical protein